MTARLRRTPDSNAAGTPQARRQLPCAHGTGSHAMRRLARMAAIGGALASLVSVAGSQRVATAQPPDDTGVVVDHRVVQEFLDLRSTEIESAGTLRMLFIDHSVGANISDGLDCTAHRSIESAPSRCRRFEHVRPELSADPALFRFGTEFGRSNWEYQVGGSSYWREWSDYVDSLLGQGGDWDVVIPMPSYLVAPNGGWEHLEELEAAHPDITIVYATSSLPRGAAGGTARDLVMQEFNAAARAYAVSHGKPLLDVADILSHDYAGNPCYDTRDGVEYCQTPDRCENLPDDGVAIPAICQHYTTELHGGHLGSVSGGALRMAQAVWVLMSQLASADDPAPGPTRNGPTTTVVPSPRVSGTRPATRTASPTPSSSSTATIAPSPAGPGLLNYLPWAEK